MMPTKGVLHGSGGTFLAKLAYFRAWQQTPVTKGIFNSPAIQCHGAVRSSFCHTFHKKFISRAKFIWFLTSKNNFTREPPWRNYINLLILSLALSRFLRCENWKKAMNRLWILLRALFVRLEASNIIQFLKDLAILARVKLSRNYSYFSCDFTICKFLLYFVFTRLPEGFSNYLGKINISSIWVFYTKISKSKYAPFLYFHFCSETVRYLSLLILNSAIAFLCSFWKMHRKK